MTAVRRGLDIERHRRIVQPSDRCQQSEAGDTDQDLNVRLAAEARPDYLLAPSLSATPSAVSKRSRTMWLSHSLADSFDRLRRVGREWEEEFNPPTNL